MEVDFCPVLCILEVPVLQAFRGISHFVWYYGFLRRDYLKNHRNSTYQVMLLQDTIGEHLLEMDKAAREREEVILKQLEEKEPLPDKEKDQMAWVRAANQHRAIAEEIILKELIYV